MMRRGLPGNERGGKMVMRGSRLVVGEEGKVITGVDDEEEMSGGDGDRGW